MKIDVHAHTLKTKSGDSENRNISPENFSEIIKTTDVKIIAITNHNHFDIEQYESMCTCTEGICQIWPGVELDIVENGKRGHMIVIVNPENAKALSDKMNELLQGKTFDSFEISIEDTARIFDPLDSIYIPHYLVKKPCINDEDIDKMYKLIKNRNRLIKEATNSISAGIYISHGHKSIYGSDIHDWSMYQEQSAALPELRLPVESFEQFCLLLNKDEPTINTLLDNKNHDSLTLIPFGPSEPIKLEIFNDINIFFGSKGTGKTEILHAISDYYNSKGHKTSVFESNKENLSDSYDIKGSDLNLTLNEMGLESCSNEIRALKTATEKNITSLSNYYRFYSSQINNKRANSNAIKDYPVEDTNASNRKFAEVNEIYDSINQFHVFASENEILKPILEDDLYTELLAVLAKVKNKVNTDRGIKYTDVKKTSFYNDLIRVFNTEIAKKTGSPTKPTSTGFSIYASNRLNIEKCVNKITNNMKKPVESLKEYVGDLGIKGELYCRTDIFAQDGSLSNGKYNTLSSIKKTPQKEFARLLGGITSRLYTNSLFEKIAELNDVTGIDEINDINDLLLYHRYFAINDELYTPSNGESSMLLLHKELSEDKDIYLLDEPEKSLGNDYINDTIVPLLKERAKLGRKVIIATHDANIAVRTLPYSSVYRKHDITQYNTYIGNPFSDNLVDVKDPDIVLNWKEISMKTLEGGKEAFGERGKIYGN